MDLLKKAFLAAEQFNDYGKGSLITYTVNRMLGIVARHENISEHLVPRWRRATKAIDARRNVVQLAFTKALIDQIGSAMMKTDVPED
ncbi:MAG: hypothetical protein N5P05_004280 (plasmid) [Chroococcopsis gigantea SAG 12.99]|jgi:hypothetical protein|nr:hypothetical protein [Chroococcopsis gigantea SAG 12.99]